MTPEQKRIGDLEDALKDKERRVEELREERDKQAELIAELREQLEECSAQIDRWIEAFDMVQGDDGAWQWAPGLAADRDKWFSKFVELRSRWNKFVGEYNAAVAPRNMGRPLQASEAQGLKVLQRHHAGESIRSIAENMELSVRTVRTIIDKRNGVDRATLARLQRIAPDKFAEARTRRSIKEIAALPKRTNANLKRNAELIKAAKTHMTRRSANMALR
jgi:hypothetical protein